MKLEADELSWEHQHNTLIISYAKPAQILEQEKTNLLIAKTSALAM